MKAETRFIHGGQKPDPSTGAIMPPVYQTSTYVQAAPGDHQGFEYSRTQNPTRKALEDNLASIEKGSFGLAFSSGMGAIDTLMKLFKPGDEIIATSDLYGGTYRLFTKAYEQYGIKFHFVDMTELDEVKKCLNSNTKMIWAETPTNPTLKIIDIEALSAIAKSASVMLCVDNTFASSYLQNPLDLGADLVMHSATKYLGGHSDVVLGALVGKSEDLHEKLAFYQNTCGAVPGPMDSFLVLRGIKTLHVRMKEHCHNADHIAKYLVNNPKVNNVYWPGLESHKGQDIAKRQMRDFGGMVSFDLKDDEFEAAKKVLSNTLLFALAESLGGVESLIGHPASMTHAAIPRDERIKNGVTDSFIRLSVGIEDANDLIEDLDQALAHI